MRLRVFTVDHEGEITLRATCTPGLSNQEKIIELLEFLLFDAKVKVTSFITYEKGFDNMVKVRFATGLSLHFIVN